MITGGCLCGNITYRIAGQPGPIWACHCRECRKNSGHFGAASQVMRADLDITGLPRWFESTPGRTRRGFCGTCGCYLFWEEMAEDHLFVLAGSMDGPTGLNIFTHVYYAEKGDYYRCTDGAPRHARGLSSEEIAP
jgi:hypothetical protein